MKPLGIITASAIVFAFSITPAVAGKTTWNLTTDGPLNLTTPGQWTIVPVSTIVVHAKAWGASGGCGPLGGCWSYGAGALTGDVTLQAGQSYVLTVGSGGKANSIAAGFGGGGNPALGTSGSGGQGGGYSGITLGATDIFMAAGGGGAGYGGTGGPGGGATGGIGGDYASNSSNGKGGTPTAGGAAGVNNSGASPTAGAARQGGNAGGAYTGGAGGGGHFGGGGGGYVSSAGGAGGGGGGSSYADPTACPAPTHFSGSSVAPYNPGNSGDPNWNGTSGKGAQAINATGADGQLRLA